jgi:bacillithiol biosynthesis deacetylase BshB1
MSFETRPIAVDILAIGVHPDDVELSCCGTLLKHIELGYSVGLLDLTKGELGTRGNAETRTEEAMKAAEMLGAKFRTQLDLHDGFFNSDKSSILKIISVVRSAKPKIILANALSDRHPDHGRAAKLIADAVFYSGLQKITTFDIDMNEQERWRPSQILHYIQDHQLEAEVIFDISQFMEKKLQIIQCFSSQFYNPFSNEPNSPISGKDFFDVIKAKNKTFGRSISVDYAEGFNTNGAIQIKDFIATFS